VPPLSRVCQCLDIIGWRDPLLTNVTIYGLTGTAGSSGRIYDEGAPADYWGSPLEPSTTPTALVDFPYDNVIPLRHIAEQANRIVPWTADDREATSRRRSGRTCWSATSDASSARSGNHRTGTDDDGRDRPAARADRYLRPLNRRWLRWQT
jgi:hypothetical protein